MRVLGIVLAGALLASCTTTSTMHLAPDRAILTTRGTAYTSSERVVRDLFLEAAKLAQAGGYEWFLIKGSQDVSTSGVFVSPATGSAYASGTPSGWSGSASYTGATAMPYTKPGMSVAVQFGNGDMPPGAIRAADVIALNTPD